ncbi:ribosome small subunit-dependent GTPase A [Pontibacillus litoralis]|uniref:Small ribosomal subunit biogenesis GTPase RsgA n=1 Tax=Pontibacillus litoralis JSM 072002 TaxID=1385512 RepID=A0A0A5GBN7_9BACI|nr:ribosome small subunit-dependent GTPase A [Pontibacillus litoralis]KGX88495.1 GTPase A [Pontibacillus litoralis JSM 072002]
MPNGQIMKALSGFYYVRSEGNLYPCKGRGNFRKKKVTPLVGDYVTFETDVNDEGYILGVQERRNELIRPPIANVDQAIVVASVVEPEFKTFLLDRFLVLVESKSIQPIIVFTKTDLASEQQMDQMEQYKRDYEALGYVVIMGSVKVEQNMEMIIPHLRGKTSVVAGQSGVGKSSLLNALHPSLAIETNDISKSLGRGKHTTRHVELIELEEGLVADTPGFSSLELHDIELETLRDYFPELKHYGEQCKFRGCMHHKEPKCAVKEAVASGLISAYRYNNYMQFYEDIQNRKPRY